MMFRLMSSSNENYLTSTASQRTVHAFVTINICVSYDDDMFMMINIIIMMVLTESTVVYVIMLMVVMTAVLMHTWCTTHARH